MLTQKGVVLAVQTWENWAEHSGDVRGGYLLARIEEYLSYTTYNREDIQDLIEYDHQLLAINREILKEIAGRVGCKYPKLVVPLLIPDDWLGRELRAGLMGSYFNLPWMDEVGNYHPSGREIVVSLFVYPKDPNCDRLSFRISNLQRV